MLKYVDYKGNEVTEIAAREGIEQILAIREYLNNLMVFLRDTTELSEEQIKEFDNTVREFNNTLDYCSPKGEEVRIDPDTYLKLQGISMELMTICGKKDESYYYEKALSMLVNIKRKPLKWVDSVMKFTTNTKHLKKRNSFFFFSHNLHRA